MALVGDAIDVCFVKMEPGGVEAREDAAALPRWMDGAR